MTVSSIGSANPYWYASAPPSSPGSPADTSGSPSDPLLELFNALSGNPQGQPASPPASATSPGASPPLLSTDTMLTLLNAQTSQPPSAANVISKFDTDGDGQISKTEFETAIGPNADTSKVDQLFSNLDTNGDGEINQDELTAAQQKTHGHHHHHHHAKPADNSQPSTDPLLAMFGTGATANASTGQDTTTASALPAAGITTLPQLAQYLEQLLTQQSQLLSSTTNLTI